MRLVGIICAFSFAMIAALASAEPLPVPGAAVPALPRNFEKNIITTGLVNSQNVMFGPDGNMILTEQAAKRITRLDPRTGKITVAVEIADAVYSPDQPDGVLGLALHPDFLSPDGGTIYLATDTNHLSTTDAGNPAFKLDNPGSIIAFQHSQHPAGRVQGECLAFAQRQQAGYVVDVCIGQQYRTQWTGARAFDRLQHSRRRKLLADVRRGVNHNPACAIGRYSNGGLRLRHNQPLFTGGPACPAGAIPLRQASASRRTQYDDA